MTENEQRWWVFVLNVRRSAQAGLFDVEFRDRGEMSGSGRVPAVPIVRIAQIGDGSLNVIGYDPPDTPRPGFGRADFEERAIEEVRKTIDAEPT